MATAISAPAPRHLWVVGILSLLWNAFGAYDYLMSKLGDAAYLEGMGFGAAEQAWMNAFPLWANAAWAIGVWASVVGSILLLLRSRQAVTAFLLSIAGALASFVYQFTSDKPESLQSGLPVIMPIVILILIVAQWYYARRMSGAGVLR